jgi:hypothetical protein
VAWSGVDEIDYRLAIMSIEAQAKSRWIHAAGFVCAI